MYTLGIESSCDEMAMAVVHEGRTLLANCIRSQTDLLIKYGGVYPEQASRRHLEDCAPLLDYTLAEAGMCLEQMDLIAVTQGPGLIGSLLVGLNFAKGLAFQTGIPLVGVNHLEAHLYAPFMNASPPLPALGLVISGGHTSLVYITQVGTARLLGQTQDDAIGEAFDKVARLLGLPYPGGPEIEKLAGKGDPYRFPFKPAQLKQRPFDFSFSGLKTAVRAAYEKTSSYPNHLKNWHMDNAKAPECHDHNCVPIVNRDAYANFSGDLNICADLAASFQRAAFETLAERLLAASKKFPVCSIVLGGGVSHSESLRRYLQERIELPLHWPPPGLSLDNGAMIAGLGTHLYQKTGAHSLDLPVMTRIPFEVYA